VIATRDTQAISDLACCPPSAGSDWARKLGARSYLGVPLLTPQGEVSGAFYVLDVHPRDWCADDLEVLPELAALAQSHVAMRQVARQAIRRAEAAQSQDEFLALVADEAPCLLWFAEVTETGEDALAWRVEVTEAAAQRFFPVTRAPGQRYVSAWYASRLTEDRARTARYAG
jgi:GAF domain-containing protein